MTFNLSIIRGLSFHFRGVVEFHETIKILLPASIFDLNGTCWGSEE